MTSADLSQAKTADDVVFAWSDFLIRATIADRDGKVKPVLPSIYSYHMDQGEVVVPTLPVVFSPDGPLCVEPGAFAYLAFLPCTYAAGRNRLHDSILEADASIVDDGDFPWYMMGVIVTPSRSATFCAAFDGDRFRPVRTASGVLGGRLSRLALG